MRCKCGHENKEHWNYVDDCDVSLSTTQDCLCKKFEAVFLCTLCRGICIHDDEGNIRKPHNHSQSGEKQLVGRTEVLGRKQPSSGTNSQQVESNHSKRISESSADSTSADTLSDKIWKIDEEIQFIQTKDIKESIKRLKDNLFKRIPENGTSLKYYVMLEEIDKIFGDKLT